MRVYEVHMSSDGSTFGTFYRTKADAIKRARFVCDEFDPYVIVSAIDLPSPINKDTIINLLNRKGFWEQEHTVLELRYNTETEDVETVYKK